MQLPAEGAGPQTEVESKLKDEGRQTSPSPCTYVLFGKQAKLGCYKSIR